MTDVRKLLDEATPLPWRDDGYMDYGHDDTFGCNIVTDGDEDIPLPITQAGYEGLEGSVCIHADAALIVHAVNHLPDYEAAVDALERMVDDDRYFSTYDPGTGDASENWNRQRHYRQHLEGARIVLSRLRGQEDAG